MVPKPSLLSSFQSSAGMVLALAARLLLLGRCGSPPELLRPTLCVPRSPLSPELAPTLAIG